MSGVLPEVNVAGWACEVAARVVVSYVCRAGVDD